MKKKLLVALLMSLCLGTTFTACSFSGNDTSVVSEKDDDDEDDDEKTSKKDKDKKDKDKKDKDKKDKDEKDKDKEDDDKKKTDEWEWDGEVTEAFFKTSNDDAFLLIDVDDDNKVMFMSADGAMLSGYVDEDGMINLVDDTIDELKDKDYSFECEYNPDGFTIKYDSYKYKLETSTERELNDIAEDVAARCESALEEKILALFGDDFYDFGFPKLWEGKEMGGVIDSGKFKGATYYQAGAAIGAVDGWGVDHNVSGCYYDSNYSNREIPNVIGGSSIGDTEGDAFRQGYDDAFYGSSKYVDWSCVFFGVSDDKDVEKIFPGYTNGSGSSTEVSTPTEKPTSGTSTGTGKFEKAQIDLSSFGTPDYEYEGSSTLDWAWYDIDSKVMGYEVDVEYNVAKTSVEDLENYDSVYYGTDKLGSFTYNGNTYVVFAYLDLDDNNVFSYKYLVPTKDKEVFGSWTKPYDEIEIQVLHFSPVKTDYDLSEAEELFKEIFK